MKSFLPSGLHHSTREMNGFELRPKSWTQHQIL